MDIPQELLSTIAEMALAIIGFSGVVTVLGHRAGESWTAEEQLALRTQVEPSAVAMFGALLPSTIALVVASEELVWRLSNGILALFMAIIFIAFLMRARKARLVMSQKVLAVVAAVLLLSICLSAINVIASHQLTFILGLWLGLIVGVHNFALLLFRIEHS